MILANQFKNIVDKKTKVCYNLNMFSNEADILFSTILFY